VPRGVGCLLGARGGLEGHAAGCDGVAEVLEAVALAGVRAERRHDRIQALLARGGGLGEESVSLLR
jgi:hypothetical protein